MPGAPGGPAAPGSEGGGRVNRSSAIWAMARRNIRRAWARNLVLAVVLTLAIAGDVLVGLFFTGLEAKAESLVPPAPQNVTMLVLAPDFVNTPSWISWANYAGGIGSSRNYQRHDDIAWQGCFTPGGRSIVLYINFEYPFLRGIQLEGRWPYDATEVALPAALAQQWGVAAGGTVQLALGDDPRQSSAFTVTGLFYPETAVIRQEGRFQRREVHQDATLSFPMLALYPGGAESPARTINGSFLTLEERNALALENRMRSYIDREYARQPAASRYAVTKPLFIRSRQGPDQAEAIGRLVFAPGRRALAAGFLFIGTGIFVILLIAFIERKRELAVLKTVGMNNRMVLAMVLAELGAVAAVALALGSALAIGVGRGVSRVVEYVPSPTVWAWLWSVVHTAAVLFLATLLPLSMMRLATVQQLLQNERLYLFRKRVTLS